MAAPETELHTEYRLVIVGAGGCGKSCLTNKFLTGYFTEDYDPTIEDSYTKKTQVDDEVCILDILDTAGQEEYSAMLDDYMRTGQGFICVYSVTDRESFRQVNKFREKLWAVKDRELTDTLPFVLVGNKIDLAEKREVTTSEGQDLAAKYKCAFMESSAKHGVNVTEAFHLLVREIRKDREVRGYNLPKSKGPDESMKEKIAKKFAKWGILESAKKQFNKLSKVLSRGEKKDKKDDKKAATTNRPSNSSPHSSAPASSVYSPPQNTSHAPVSHQPVNVAPVHSDNLQSSQTRQQPIQQGIQPGNQPVQQGIQPIYPVQQQGQQPVQQPVHQTQPAIVPVNQPGSNNLSRSQNAPTSKMNNIESDLQSWIQEMNDPAPSSNASTQPNSGLANALQSSQNAHGSVYVSSPPGPQLKPLQPVNYGKIPKLGPADLDFSKFEYFHGKITGGDVNVLLAGKPLGTFLVRASSQPNHLAVSYVLDSIGTIQSVLVGFDSTGIWMVDGDPSPQKYSTLDLLIKDYDNVLQYPLIAAKQKADTHYGKIPFTSNSSTRKL